MVVKVRFRLVFSGDFFDGDGQPRFREYGHRALDGCAIETAQFSSHSDEMTVEQIGDAQAVVSLAPRVTAKTLSRSENLLAIARAGVGYDMVDVAACTKADVLLTISKGAVDRPVAEAVVGWMIALSHHVLAKDRLLREGRWLDRTHYMGTELRDRTLGIIGLGGIGKALVKLLAGFNMKPPLAFDPYLSAEDAQAAGARRVHLDELMSEADFVSINCPLNAETRGLIGRRELALMKPTAYLINTARGGIVDEDGLFDVLADHKIAGAGIDCFVGEPIMAPHRFGTLDNVLLAPHSIAWTDELFRDIGEMACRSVVDLAYGRRPHGVVNSEVLERPGFREKWERLRLPA